MYHIDWIVESRIALIQPIGDQNLQDIQEMNESMIKLVEAGNPPVHVINDSRYIGKYPADIGTLKQMMKSHENMGHTIIVGGNSLVKFTVSVLIKVIGEDNLVFKNDINEGIHYLQHIDSTLPEAIPYEDKSPV